jgi:hypothetical protein
MKKRLSPDATKRRGVAADPPRGAASPMFQFAPMVSLALDVRARPIARSPLGRRDRIQACGAEQFVRRTRTVVWATSPHSGDWVTWARRPRRIVMSASMSAKTGSRFTFVPTPSPLVARRIPKVSSFPADGGLRRSRARARRRVMTPGFRTDRGTHFSPCGGGASRQGRSVDRKLPHARDGFANGSRRATPGPPR